MTWIICAGIDRTGKSTLADHYKSKGYEVIHMSAPDKKYFQPGYVGPSYLDEMLDMYMSLNGKNVFFDRTIYGELIWSQVYGREPQLDDDAYEILRDYEEKNNAEKILMWDSKTDAHWQRCIENKEPLTKSQFILARKLYQKMADDHGFTKLELPDWQSKNTPEQLSTAQTVTITTTTGLEPMVIDMTKSQMPAVISIPSCWTVPNDTPQQKLEKANAINSILSKRIIKGKDPLFEQIELDVRAFLQSKLEVLLGNTQASEFTEEEKTILKLYAKRILEKQKESK